MREKNRSRAAASPLRAWSSSCVISPMPRDRRGRQRRRLAGLALAFGFALGLLFAAGRALALRTGAFLLSAAAGFLAASLAASAGFALSSAGLSAGASASSPLARLRLPSSSDLKS